MTACVKSTCTIKESLTTENFTETSCGKPIRNNTKAGSYPAVAGGIIAVVAVLLRVVARLPVLGGGFGWDDVMIILGLVWLSTCLVNIMLMVLGCGCCHVGLRRHSYVEPRSCERCRASRNHTDFFLVANLGLGKDIWTIPFPDLTQLLYVS